MLMKVFNKGQVVIPAEIRRDLGISAGDLLDVLVDAKNGSVQMKPYHVSKAKSLAGSLYSYARNKKTPTRREMAAALKKGLS